MDVMFSFAQSPTFRMTYKLLRSPSTLILARLPRNSVTAKRQKRGTAEVAKNGEISAGILYSGFVCWEQELGSCVMFHIPLPFEAVGVNTAFHLCYFCSLILCPPRVCGCVCRKYSFARSPFCPARGLRSHWPVALNGRSLGRSRSGRCSQSWIIPGSQIIPAE